MDGALWPLAEERRHRIPSPRAWMSFTSADAALGDTSARYSFSLTSSSSRPSNEWSIGESARIGRIRSNEIQNCSWHVSMRTADAGVFGQSQHWTSAADEIVDISVDAQAVVLALRFHGLQCGCDRSEYLFSLA